MSLGEELKELLEKSTIESETKSQYLNRINEGLLTRDENHDSHFCVYFPALDKNAGEVFIGHHKKSGLWLFNGGHIDQGELLTQALSREITEEWGISIPRIEDIKPFEYSVTYTSGIHVVCTVHFDIWFPIFVQKETFSPDPMTLSTEYHQISWMKPAEARKYVTDANTLKVLHKLESSVF